MRTEPLLPPGIRDDAARAHASLVDRFDALDPAVTLVDLIDRVDASALPSLLAQFHVDFVKPGEGEARHRARIKDSVAWHSRKGTPDAVADLIWEMLEIRPQVREPRRYFVLGASALGDTVSGPPWPGFQAGISRLGVTGLGMPRLWFLADVILPGNEAKARAVTQAELVPLIRAVKPARAWVTARFTPLLLGDPDYGRLGVDLF